MKTIVVFLLFHYSFQLSNDSNIFHFGTKSPYRLVKNAVDNVVTYPGCKPMKIIGIIRHGTRTPGVENVVKMEKTLSNLKEDFIYNDNGLNSYGIGSEDAKLLKNWTFSMDTNGEKFLTREGEREMYQLAKRLQNRFPSLLLNYNNDSFLFKFTKTQRTEESAKYFTYGLFGNNNKKIWFPQPEDPDPVLRFYKFCKKWRNEVKKSKVSTEERNKFIKSVEMQTVQKAISERLGLNYTLAFETIKLIYSICSLETAWFPTGKSPWCTLLKKSDIKTLEYAEELKYYWRDGYGFDINYKQTCPLLNNILEFLLEEKKPNAVFYFTHSGTILKLLSSLGLYKDPFPLTADLDLVSRENRLWKVSYIDTFATNIIFTLFSCEGGSDGVLISHQERPVQVGGCPSPPQLCPLSEVRKFLAPPGGCNFQEICGIRHHQ